jgi:putative redox protein
MPQVEVRSQSPSDFKQEIKYAGHKFVADAPKDAGGSEAGPDPHELLLGALGACTSITLQMYAKRKGWDLKEVKVKVTEEKVDDTNNPGQTISKINREISVDGNLPADQIETLKGIADKCPIHKLLSGPKQIVTAINHV